jgi:glyoxylase-like metal-dependent hydrolase (beta-lactamase superfamily II)
MLNRSILCVTIAFSATAALAACGDETGTGGSGGTTTSTTASTGENTGGNGGTGGTGGAGGGVGGGSADLTIQTYTSSIDPPTDVGVSSHLIQGKTEAVLVDGQFFTTDAQAVVKMVNDSGKTLTTIFLTHVHPDHYGSLETIQKAFPNAKVVSTQAVVDAYGMFAAGTLAGLNMSPVGPLVDDNTVTLTAVTGSIKLEGIDIKIIEAGPDGESKDAAMLATTTPNAIFAGDILYNNLHLVLSECGEKGWLANIQTIKGMNFTEFYPGHGAKADASILDANTKYINDVIPILDAAADSDAAQTQIKAAYPNYKGLFLLDFSTDNYFMNNCKAKP